jgi:hypothetical protein
MTSTTTPRERARRDLAVVWSVGLLAAVLLGWAAAAQRDGAFWQAFLVFTACLLGPCIGFAWLLLGAGRRIQADTEADENVEARWFRKAGSGALLDTLAVAGLTAAALSIFALTPPADVALIGVVAFGLADATLRYAVLARREA